MRNPTGGDPATNRAFIEQLQSSASPAAAARVSDALSDSSFIQQLDPRLARPFLVAIRN